MIHYWCMRFEGRHSYYKDLAHRGGSLRPNEETETKKLITRQISIHAPTRYATVSIYIYTLVTSTMFGLVLGKLVAATTTHEFIPSHNDTKGTSKRTLTISKST